MRTSVFFDDWIDPIEHAVRDRVRSFIEERIESELETVLARPRYGRRAQDGGGGANSGGVATELDALAVATEAERRGRLRPTPGKAPKKRQAEDDSRLTSGQQNAVRAAFKAGVKPSAIARQFRIAQSEVRKALAKETRQSKS